MGLIRTNDQKMTDKVGDIQPVTNEPQWVIEGRQRAADQGLSVASKIAEADVAANNLKERASRNAMLIGVMRNPGTRADRLLEVRNDLLSQGFTNDEIEQQIKTSSERAEKITGTIGTDSSK